WADPAVGAGNCQPFNRSVVQPLTSSAVHPFIGLHRRNVPRRCQMRHDITRVVAASLSAFLRSGGMSTATAPAPAAAETRPLGRAHVTTIGNFKGGPGKTSVCVNLAAALARKGYKVLVVDMDAQANATRRLDAQIGEDSMTVSEVIERGARQP